MVPHVVFYQLLVVALVVIYLLIRVWWPDAPSASPPRPARQIHPDASAPQSPSRLLASSTYRCVRRVSREPTNAPRRQAHPFP